MGKPSKDSDKILDWVHRLKENQNDTEAFGNVVAVLDGFLQHLSVKKFFFIHGHSSDDIYQEGLLALTTKAIPDYDEQKGSFLSFAKLCIRRHIITVLKAANNGKNRTLNMSVSMDQTVSDDEDGPIPISGFIPSDDVAVMDSMIRFESHGKLKSLLLSRLTDLEAKVLDLYLKNMSYMDIVDSMNSRRRGKNRVDCKTIDNALCRIKKKAMDIESSHRHGSLMPDADEEEFE